MTAQELPDLETWVAALRGGKPSAWQMDCWEQWQGGGLPAYWSPLLPWTEKEMSELLVLWLVHGIARGGRRQLVWATGRRGGERPFFLAAREIARKLAEAESGDLGCVSRLLRSVSPCARTGVRDPLAVISFAGCVTGGQRWLPAEYPAMMVMDVYDLVGGLLFRARGAMDGQASQIAAGLSAAAAWIVVDSIVPRAAWQSLHQIRDALAQEPGVRDRPQLSFISRCAPHLPAAKPVGAPIVPGEIGLRPVEVARGELVPKIARLVVQLGAELPAENVHHPQAIIVVNEAATAMALRSAMKSWAAGEVRVITGQEPRRIADRLWRDICDSPQKAAIWVLSGVGDVTALPMAAHMITEVAPWDVLAQRVGQWAGKGPIAVVGGHQADGPGAVVWQSLSALAGTDGVVSWSLAAAAATENEAGWSAEGFASGPLLTSGFLDMAVQSGTWPDCPVEKAVWGGMSGVAEVGVLWRRELQTEPPERWGEIIRLLPPTEGETCRVDARALAESLKTGRWVWSPGRVGGGRPLDGMALEGRRGVICRADGSIEVFGLLSPLGEVLSGQLSPGDTVILPPDNCPFESLLSGKQEGGAADALWAAGYPAFLVGPHLPELESFPWRRWWMVARRKQTSQKRLSRWLTALVSYLHRTGETEMAGRLKRALDSGTPAVLLAMSDGVSGWVLFPWAVIHHPGDGDCLPPGMTWRPGIPQGPHVLTTGELTAVLEDTIRNIPADPVIEESMRLAAKGLFLGLGYPPLRGALDVLTQYFPPGYQDRQQQNAYTSGPSPAIHWGAGACSPLVCGWILSREPGSPGRNIDAAGSRLAVWDDLPWEFLSVGCLEAVIQTGAMGDVLPEVAELALYLVGVSRGQGRPLPARPGSGQLSALAEAAGHPFAPVTFPEVKDDMRIPSVAGLGSGVAERFWKMQQRFGRWGAARLEDRWRWLVWYGLRQMAGVVTCPDNPLPVERGVIGKRECAA